MTTFSDPGFRVTGPDDDSSDPDVDIDVDLTEAELDVDDESELDLEDELDVDDELDADGEADIELEDDADFDHEDDDDLESDVDEDELEDLDEADLELELDDESVEDLDLPDDEPLIDADDPVEPAPEPEAETELHVAATSAGDVPGALPFWTASQVAAVGRRAIAVLVVMGILGFGLGALRGNSYVARSEFVYTLDESVPDSFLREDRRLLTQVVTFRSDAVLTPVAEDFGLTVDQLRSKIDVETLDLSEVLRFDVSDADEDRAIALSRAVLNQYLQVITDASPAGDSTAELAQRRADVAAELAAADAERETLVDAQQRDIALEVRQASIQRQINLRNDQLSRIQESLDDALINSAGASRTADLTEQYEATQEAIAELEADLIDVGGQRAALASQTTAEPALLREIDRLETVLTTIDDELSQRDLAPLVASPIRELSEPIVLFQSRNIFGLQGMAIGLLLGFPIAGLIAYRTRKQQLWFD